jgi:hypothetical protein
MKHLHTETVAYDGRSYCRAYTHDHGFEHEAHLHRYAWEGRSAHQTQSFPMAHLGEVGVPVVQTSRAVVTLDKS